ncbi:hypothetical protein C10C_0045 [Chlamydia serpentis]|uniref:Uncharacterized protein n=1 Tax=Chlamydia serpentis TaxID=1967782 RepID=A0A2R8FAA7_9CHLA|nr:hypothetical protein [Chlamydia serpentis]SPN73236.1 hypothetical protein C10C_0045 [Chlamydia serpentis]
MSSERIVSHSQIPAQREQEILISKSSQKFQLCRVLSIIVAVLTFIGGGVLLGLTGAAVLPLLPYLILAVILTIVSACLLVTVLYSKRIKKVVGTGGVESKHKEVTRWFQERKRVDMEDPSKSDKNNALSAFNKSLHFVRNSPTLTDVYKNSQDIFLFKNWSGSNFSDVGQKEEKLIRDIVGCYLLMETTTPKLPQLTKELTNLLNDFLFSTLPTQLSRSLFGDVTKELGLKILSLNVKNRATHFLAYTKTYDGFFTVFRAGAQTILKKYSELRRTNDKQLFFTPGHSCYYARLAFNATIELYHSLFNIKQLREIYANKDKDPACQQPALNPIYDLLITTDNGESFLKDHQVRKYGGRSLEDHFYA